MSLRAGLARKAIAPLSALALASLPVTQPLFAQGTDSPVIVESPESGTRSPSPHALDPARFRLDHRLPGTWRPRSGIGLEVADVTGNGIPEIFVFGRHDWTVLGWSPLDEAAVLLHFHENAWTEPDDESETLHARLADADADGELEVLLFGANGSVQAHDARTGRLEDTTILARAALGVAVAQILPGGPADLVVRTADGLAVHSYLDPDPDVELTGLGTAWDSSLALAQLDGDPQLEIVHMSPENLPTTVIVRDGLTLAEQWRLSIPEYGKWAVGDVDADGRQDLVIGERDSRLLTARDLQSGELSWTSFTERDLDGIRLIDVLGDSALEVLPHDGARTSRVKLHDGRTGELLTNSIFGDSRYATLADIDGDCELEWIWAGASSIQTGKLHEADQVREWFRPIMMGPMPGMRVVDLDADGRSEILTLTTQHRSTPRRTAMSWDLHGRRLEHLSPAVWGGFWNLAGLAAGNLDADPQLEYVTLETQHSPSGQHVLGAWDGRDHDLQWTTELPFNSELWDVEIADADVDGTVEVLVAIRTSIPSRGVQLLAIEASSGEVLAMSEVGSNRAPRELLVTELDGDPESELVVTAGRGIETFDGDGLGLLRRDDFSAAGASTVTDVEPIDLDGDGDLDLLLAFDNGEIMGWDWLAESELLREPLGGDTVHAITLAELDDLPGPELVATIGFDASPGNFARSALQVRAWPGLELLWEAAPLSQGAGELGALVVADADDDGALEILVGSAYSLLAYEYSLPGASSDVEPPVEGPFTGVGLAEARGNDECCPWVDLSWQPARDALSPPIHYRVHRSEVPGFTPGPDTLLSETPAGSFRDATVLPETEYTYLVRAVDRRGNEDSNLQHAGVLTPPPHPPGAATLETATDLELCVASGVEIVFTQPDSIHPLRFDLMASDLVVAEDITSPFIWFPPDAAWRNYRVVTRYRSCALQALSNGLRQLDQRAILLEPARHVRLTDPDPCRSRRARIRFSHPGFGWAEGHHELWRDGSLFLASIGDGDEVDPLDLLAHDYEVRSFDHSCAQEERSVTALHADETGCTNPTIAVTRPGAGEFESTWEPYAGVSAYNAYVGTLGSLWPAGGYDHESARPGLSFPISSTPGDGCDVAGGPAGLARLRESPSLGSSYILVVSVLDPGGEQEYGTNSNDLDRRNPSVDPRGLSFACP